MSKRRSVEKISIDDVLTGILVSLPERGINTIDSANHKWAYAFRRIMPNIKDASMRRGLKPNFEVYPNAIHGTSDIIGDALCRAVNNGILRQESEIYFIDIPLGKSAYLGSIPGDEKFYSHLAGRFDREFFESF